MKIIYILMVLCSVTFRLTASNVIKKDEIENLIDSDDNGLVCTTPGCIKAAQIVQDNLDESVEPCDDFFKFACGGFTKRTTIPNDKGQVTYFNIIGDRILKQLQAVLEEPSLPNEIIPFSYLKKFYKLCMDNQAIEKDGLQTVKGLLQKFGGWPVLEGANWNETEFEWKDILYKFRKLGIPSSNIVYVVVTINSLNSSQLIIEIDGGTLGLDREYLIQGTANEVVKAYYEYLVDLAIIFGADKEIAEKEIKDALDFEIKIAELSLSRAERRNATATTNQMTIEEMQEKFPSIPWLEFLTNLADRSSLVLIPSNVTNVVSPNFLIELKKLLETTPKRVQANYLFYRALATSGTFLNQELRDRYLVFAKVAEGISEHKPRWKECTAIASLNMHIAAGALYVRNYFNKEAKRIVEELVVKLKQAFIEMLKQLDWMDEDTKAKAIEKAEEMSAFVGYSQEFLDDEKLNEYYSELNGTANNFLEFGMNVRRFAEGVDYGVLPEPYNRTDWIQRSFIASVDAYYNRFENGLQLPAGILQSPFFSADRPRYMDYGSIGFAIGHEITHGFDDLGRQFDKYGSANNWWAEKTKQAFVEKAQCFIDQYGNFTPPEVNKHLNGIVTLGENIADNGGVKEAYLAYEKWIKTNGEEPRLPDLKYSPKQLFWISTANLWCTTQKTEYLKEHILTDVHSPPNFRVLGSLRNSELFSKDFECPLGSNMNPVHKCHVW